MAIQFACSACGQILQTPDQTAGKKTRCPKCQAVMAVPDEHSSAGDAVASAYQPPRDQPGEEPSPQTSPLSNELRAAVFGPPTEPRPHKLTLDEMFNRTWIIFTNRLGILVLFALLMMGLNGVVSVGTMVINFSTQMAAQLTNEIWIMFVGQGVTQIISFVFQSWVQAGAMIYMLKMARYGQVSFNEVFRGLPFLWRSLLFTLLILLVVYGIPGLLATGGFVALAQQAEPAWIIAGFAPAVVIGLPLITWLMLSWYLTIAFIVDRDMKLNEAIRQSHRFMRGNRFMVFVAGAVVGVLAVLLLIITCFLPGMLFVIPYAMLFSCVVYLLATGQGTGGEEPSGKPAPAENPLA